MAEGFPVTNLFRTLRDSFTHSELAACLCRLLPFTFVSQDGKHAFHQTACIQPTIDGFEADYRLSLLTEPLHDLLGRPRGLKLLFNKGRLLRCPFSGRDRGLAPLDITLLRSLGAIWLLR
ncbi:hypothetical protein D3C74_333240 [compost metagenome]